MSCGPRHLRIRRLAIRRLLAAALLGAVFGVIPGSSSAQQLFADDFDLGLADWAVDSLSFGVDGYVTTDFYDTDDRANAATVDDDGYIIAVGSAADRGRRPRTLRRP